MNQPEADAKLWLQFSRLAKRSVMVIVAVGEVPPLLTLTATWRNGGRRTVTGSDLAAMIETLIGPLPRREEALTEKEVRRRRFEKTLAAYEQRHTRQPS